jgi:hypothetical protein
VASITIKHHDNGALSVEGYIGNKAYALAMLKHAEDAIRGQMRPDGQKIAMPNRDVELVTPEGLGWKARGDMGYHDLAIDDRDDRKPPVPK